MYPTLVDIFNLMKYFLDSWFSLWWPTWLYIWTMLVGPVSCEGIVNSVVQLADCNKFSYCLQIILSYPFWFFTHVFCIFYVGQVCIFIHTWLAIKITINILPPKILFVIPQLKYILINTPQVIYVCNQTQLK